jgi:hypothetical protein
MDINPSTPASPLSYTEGLSLSNVPQLRLALKVDEWLRVYPAVSSPYFYRWKPMVNLMNHLNPRIAVPSVST